ncbi:MAG TPA: aspartyl/asparaginyl beta-hydroxylase domain-containing protein [Casimicrobiaceae bacterium]|nr:aspartyl/asparaginyl beta-hydroxylase domain-containing protein [Casimicrobiaceae bacterium]
MQIPDSLAREIAPLEAQLERAVQAGRDQEVLTLLGRILAIAPAHVPALAALGQRSFRQGDMETARSAFQRLVAVRGDDPQEWINLALSCRSLDDEQGETDALKRALSLDPSNLLALILRADLLERQGKKHEAAGVHRAVATVAPPMDRLHPDLRPAVQRALAFSEKYNREFAVFLDQFLEQQYREHAGENLKRFRDSVDIMLGRKKRYDSQSVTYHFPYLAPIEFFERADFPWLDPFEAATDAIRDEFLQVLAAEAGFTPYISYPDDVPKNQFAELNNSPRWSAFHLYKMGRKVEENAARCPITMNLLQGAPLPEQQGRTPAAMFSLLKPMTRIPAHTGVTNVRLVTHLPLIVPEKCGFRVGNDTREWVPGKAWVFDDTIEHEAWNDSDKLRVVLIFDIWHPHLTPPERAMISGLSAAMNAFSGALETAESS